MIFICVCYLFTTRKKKCCLLNPSLAPSLSSWYTMAEHYCSRHKRYLPLSEFSVNSNGVSDCCNACLESDHIRHNVDHTAIIAAAFKSISTIPEIYSTLDGQKEQEHFSHSIIFNSEKPFDIQLSIPGDNIAKLDPATEIGSTTFKSYADNLAHQFWKLLGYRWR